MQLPRNSEVCLGDLICRVEAQYGKSGGVFDEANYIALPPCLFGYEPGLRKPLTLLPSTRLRAIKVQAFFWLSLDRRERVLNLVDLKKDHAEN